MVKKVNLARIMERLRERFDLEDLTPEIFKLIETIMPMTNVDELLKETRFDTGTLASTSTGWKDVVEIPKGQRWTPLGLNIIRSTGSSAQFSNIAALLRDETVQGHMSDETAGSNIIYLRNINMLDITLNEGDKIQVYVSTAEASSVLTYKLTYAREYAY